MGGITSISLSPDSSSTVRARQFVVEQLSDKTTETALQDAVLVTSELVTNALLHGRGSVGLSLQTHGERVRIEVVDQGSDAVIRIRPRKPDMTWGWGLQIVDELSERWGTSEGTTRVWAELPLS